MKKIIYTVVFISAFIVGMLNVGLNEVEDVMFSANLNSFIKQVSAQNELPDYLQISNMVRTRNSSFNWSQSSDEMRGTGTNRVLGCKETTCPNGNMTCNIQRTYGSPTLEYTSYTTYGNGSYSNHYSGAIVAGGGVSYDYSITYNCDYSPVPGQVCASGSEWSNCQPCDLCEGDYNFF